MTFVNSKDIYPNAAHSSREEYALQNANVERVCSQVIQAGYDLSLGK